VVMRVIAIANDGVQKRAQDSHSAFNEEKRFEPEGWLDLVSRVAVISGGPTQEKQQRPGTAPNTANSVIRIYSINSQQCRLNDSNYSVNTSNRRWRI
jgi:hypothetical protein